jgi:hypothetical protein
MTTSELGVCQSLRGNLHVPWPVPMTGNLSQLRQRKRA